MHNLRIHMKLLIGFGSLILFLIVFSLITYFTISDIQNNLIPARAAVRTMHIASLEMRRYEKDFLARDTIGAEGGRFFREGTSQNLEKWQREWEIFYTNYTKMTKFEENRPGISDIENHRKLQTYMDTYNEAFKKITEKYRIRGFNTFGLEGELIEAGRALEAQVTSPNEKVLVLQMRSYEKNFFLRKDVAEVTRFNEFSEELRSSTRNTQTIQLLTSYSDLFNRVVTLDTEIGLNPDTGLIGEMRKAFREAEPILIEEERDVIRTTDTAIGFFNKLSVVLSLLFILLSIALSLFISRIISHPLRRIQTAAGMFAKGDLKTRIQISSSDEIGDLSRTFNQMAARLEKSYGELHSKNDSLTSSITDLEQTKKAMLNILEDLDVSKKRIEREKAKDEALLSSIGDGVFALDKDKKIILFNKAASEISGYSEHEVIGKYYAEVLQFTVEGSTSLKDDFIRVALSGQLSSMPANTFLKHKDGRQIPVADSAAPLIGKNGEMEGMVVVFRDVTKERELETAKDEFVSLASHQLRTPATGVKAFLSMLIDGYGGELNETQKDFAVQAFQSNERQLIVINDLLHIARVESGRSEVVRTEVNLVELIEESLLEQSETIKSRKQVVDFQKPEKDIVALLDADKMGMILDNFISNASKYTPEGGTVGVGLLDEGERVKIVVRDTGVGIAEEDVAKLFQKFVRIDNELSTKVGGTGLGLYLAKKMIDLHHGEVHVESTLGKGTTFTITLPKGV